MPSPFLQALEARALLSTYQLIDLGTLGGTVSKAYDVNNNNQVVGVAKLASGADRAFVFKDANGDGVANPGEMVDLGVLTGDTGSFAFGINDAGVAVGTSSGSAGSHRAVRFQAGSAVNDLGLGDGSNAYEINNSGEIVGGATTASRNYFAFYRSAGGTVTSLDALGGGRFRSSEAYAINAGGTVVGYTNVDAGDSGFIRPPGGPMAPLGFPNPPAGLQYEYAWDVNTAGHVVGEGFNSDGDYHGFLYDGTTVNDVGTLTGFDSSKALGINSADQVVGQLESSAGAKNAFVYAGGVLRNLNDLIPGSPGWVLTEARAINDAGYIVGTGTTPSGETHAFLLKPAPPKVTSAEFAFATAPRRLVLRFSDNVGASLGADDVTVTNLTTGGAVTGFTLDYNSQDNIATLTFPTELADGNYRATLVASGVTDSSGTVLDGDGDSNPGGNFVFNFFSLAGDANHDRSVDFNDLVALAQNYNTTGGKTFSQGDFTGDGNVDFNDLVILAQRYNTQLPPPASPAAAPIALVPTSSALALASGDPLVDVTQSRQKPKPRIPTLSPVAVRRLVTRPTFGNTRLRAAR